MIDSEKLVKNCLSYMKSHPKAIEILKKANGKKDYKTISRELNLNEKTVSPILSEAKKLGLAIKEKNFYKKRTGILKYMPKQKGKIRIQNKGKLIKIFKKNMMKKNIPNIKCSIKIDKNKAEKMVSAYGWLYLTENTFRNLIRKVFSQEKDWWKNKVDASIQKEIKRNISKDKYYSPKKMDQLDYTHLGQLMGIIISKNDWKNFLPFLKEKQKETFKVLFSRIIPFRNAIGHCIPLKNEDYKSIEVKFKDILEMLN